MLRTILLDIVYPSSLLWYCAAKLLSVQMRPLPNGELARLDILDSLMQSVSQPVACLSPLHSNHHAHRYSITVNYFFGFLVHMLELAGCLCNVSMCTLARSCVQAVLHRTVLVEVAFRMCRRQLILHDSMSIAVLFFLSCRYFHLVIVQHIISS